jgi:hypothetical protein
VDCVTANEPKARRIGSYFTEKRPAPTAASAAILGWISRYWSRTGSGPAAKLAVASTYPVRTPGRTLNGPILRPGPRSSGAGDTASVAAVGAGVLSAWYGKSFV